MTTPLRVEMDRLAELAKTLHGLADEAGGFTTVGSASNPLAFLTTAQTSMTTTGKGVPSAVTEALSIAHDLVDTAMVPTVKARLSETGDTMTNVANRFRNAAESMVSVGQAAAAYTNTTGDWDVPPVPMS